VHRIASLLKRWLLGTHQGSASPAHLDAYLNEFSFRFNRRRSRRRGLLFYRLLQQAILAELVTYRQLVANPQPRDRPQPLHLRRRGRAPAVLAADRPWRRGQLAAELNGYPVRPIFAKVPESGGNPPYPSTSGLPRPAAHRYSSYVSARDPGREQSEQAPDHGVGGILVELDEVSAIEDRWNEAKMRVGMGQSAVKYSMSWPDRVQRGELIASIGELPLRCAAVLLEDFRPMRLKLRKDTRSDIYVYARAFEWLLQRLASPLFCPASKGPHIVVFDLRDDLRKLAAEYSRHHASGWTFATGQVPSLRSLGYSASLYATDRGPLIEIADLVISALTRWAGARCQAHQVKNVPELSELERDCAALRDLFPTKTSIAQRWRGYSIVTFRENRTGKELLYRHLDQWLRELPMPIGSSEGDEAAFDEIPTKDEDDDIPF
jgi:hypothetical protein